VFSITGMTHGVPLATGKGDESCGAPGPFFLNVGIPSTNHIARFWGLITEAKPWSSAAKTVSPAIGAGLRETEVITNSGRATLEPTVAHVESNETGSRRRHLDANAVIAAAFEAAGLPTPENTNQQPGTVSPGPIIEAALKTAGLVRR
jgi:hypothetical protein